MVKKKLISILVALSVITSMGMTGVYADEPTDATVTMEATEVVTDTTEATETETATDIATEPTEETGVSTEAGTDNTEVTDTSTEGESTETTTATEVIEGEAMTANGGIISFDTHSVPLNMFNGVTYKITDESGAEVVSGKLNVSAEDTSTVSAVEFKGTLEEGKKYKVSFGGFGAEMGVSAIDIVSCQASVQAALR